MNNAQSKPEQLSRLTIRSDNKYYEKPSDYAVLSNYCNVRVKRSEKKPKTNPRINNTPSLEGVKQVLLLQLLTDQLNQFHPLSKRK